MVITAVLYGYQVVSCHTPSEDSRSREKACNLQSAISCNENYLHEITVDISPTRHFAY